MTENAPPEKAKGSASSDTDEAPISKHHRRSHHHEKPASKEIVDHCDNIKAAGGTSGKNLVSIIACGRLADARKVFAHRGWESLPQGRRGQKILRWGADHAWMASPTSAKQSVRRWCHRWAPRLKPAELDKLITDTEKSNKRWSPDQCATVLEITVSDRKTLGLRFIGASDDPDYEQRRVLNNEKSAARSRKYRADHSTGRKRGRPRLEVPAWKAAGYNSKRTYQRHKANGTLAQNGTKNASRDISKNRMRDGIKVPPPPIAIIPASALALDGIDFKFKLFGITAIRVMSGTRIIREWCGPPQ